MGSAREGVVEYSNFRTALGANEKKELHFPEDDPQAISHIVDLLFGQLRFGRIFIAVFGITSQVKTTGGSWICQMTAVMVTSLEWMICLQDLLCI